MDIIIGTDVVVALVLVHDVVLLVGEHVTSGVGVQTRLTTGGVVETLLLFLLPSVAGGSSVGRMTHDTPAGTKNYLLKTPALRRTLIFPKSD